jgi:hypothetical protein
MFDENTMIAIGFMLYALKNVGLLLIGALILVYIRERIIGD